MTLFSSTPSAACHSADTPPASTGVHDTPAGAGASIIIARISFMSFAVAIFSPISLNMPKTCCNCSLAIPNLLCGIEL